MSAGERSAGWVACGGGCIYMIRDDRGLSFARVIQEHQLKVDAHDA